MVHIACPVTVDAHTLNAHTRLHNTQVRIWDPASGHLRSIFTGHNGGVRGLEFIGSGTILFSASKDKTVGLYTARQPRM